jgi:heme/copper-type cytochrome/quinol oxidase subunit 2
MLRNSAPQTARILAPFVVLALAVSIMPVTASSSPVTRTLTLDMRQFEFSPPRIEVNPGDRIILTLRADDVTHGFALDGYGLQTRVEPGISQRIEFVANRSGKFRYRCSVTCGPMHPFMIGELVVGPTLWFWRAGALALITAVGLLVMFWHNNNQTLERINL